MRSTKVLYLSLVALFMSFATTACAEQQTDQDYAGVSEASPLEESLLQAIADYDSAIAKGEIEKFVNFGMSPKVLNHLAIEDGHPKGSESNAAFAEGTRREMVAVLEATLNAVTKFEYEYALDNLSFQTTASGLRYVRLPTVTKIEVPNRTIRSIGETIAVFDDDQWYFLNPQDAESIGWIKSAYPELEGLQIEPNKMEIVSK